MIVIFTEMGNAMGSKCDAAQCLRYLVDLLV
jgi:hypothetical protein